MKKSKQLKSHSNPELTFKFDGHKVTVTDGKLHADDIATQTLLAPLVKGGSGDPEKGDPFLKLVKEIFGIASVTDVVFDYPDDMVH